MLPENIFIVYDKQFSDDKKKQKKNYTFQIQKRCKQFSSDISN